MTDEFAIRAASKKLSDYYYGIDYLIHDTTAPRGERTMRPAPGPKMPGNFLWMNRKVECEQRLREVAFNAFRDIRVKLKDEDMKVKNLLERVHNNAYAIASLPWADDFLGELHDQIDLMDKWMTVVTPAEVATRDPYLTADSIQRTLTSKGLGADPATIRQWASRGHVDTKTRRDGKRAYRLADIIKRLTAK